MGTSYTKDAGDGTTSLRGMTRRHLLAWTGAATAAMALTREKRAFGASPKDAHFFLFIAIQGGLDGSYYFDARHPYLTEKNKKSNYMFRNDKSGAATLKGEFTQAKVDARTSHCPETGASALRSPLVDELAGKFGSRFSVVNGVYMLRDGFAGHPQNSSYLFCNTPGGGEFFAPLVAQSLAASQGSSTPLDTAIFGVMAFSPSPDNLASSVSLAPGTAVALGGALKASPLSDNASVVMTNVLARTSANQAAGAGLFSQGAAAMDGALRRAPELGRALATVADGAPDASRVAQNPQNVFASLASPLPPLRDALAYFAAGVTRVATLSLLANVDFHGDEQSQTSALSTHAGIGKELHDVFDLLSKTPFHGDGTSAPVSFLDVTTVMITSEFTRTNKKSGSPDIAAGASGTDHNAFANSVLLGGKGIQGGLVVGESDLTDLGNGDAYERVSGAHRAKDPDLNFIMGKPFDFATGRTRADLPGTYDEKDYLCMPSVVNTVLHLFGVPVAHHHQVGRKPAPIVTRLLTGSGQ